MPLAKLREKQKSARAEVLAHGHRGTEKQAPEPMNRMLRRDMVTDRRVTKQSLRTLINQDLVCGAGQKS